MLVNFVRVSALAMLKTVKPCLVAVVGPPPWPWPWPTGLLHPLLSLSHWVLVVRVGRSRGEAEEREGRESERERGLEREMSRVREREGGRALFFVQKGLGLRFSFIFGLITCFSQVPTPNLLMRSLNSSRNLLQLTSLIKLRESTK